jgi:hypothetical protein
MCRGVIFGQARPWVAVGNFHANWPNPSGESGAWVASADVVFDVLLVSVAS